MNGRRGREQSQGEFERFVRERRLGLFRVALLLTGERAQAEDLVQSALLRISGQWAAARRSPDAYARRVLVNLSRDDHRRQLRRVTEVPASEYTELPASGDLAQRVGERDAMLAGMRCLPQRQREVVVLRYYLDLSVSETADAMRCSQGAVKSYNSRAVARLKVELEGPPAPVTAAEASR